MTSPREYSSGLRSTYSHDTPRNSQIHMTRSLVPRSLRGRQYPRVSFVASGGWILYASAVIKARMSSNAGAYWMTVCAMVVLTRSVGIARSNGSHRPVAR